MEQRKQNLLIRSYITFCIVFLFFPAFLYTQQQKDTRHETLRDADHYEIRMAPVSNLDEWKVRREEVRETLLLRAGLWPEPERTPLNAKVFDERKGDGFTVSKVYFESLPGFYATGNLYRPTKGKPPYPAVVTPHGHWQYGRLQNSEMGSIPGRCIDFARMGFVVFSIDMVGYNDSFQLPHDPSKSLAQLKADKPLPYEPRQMRADFHFPEAELYGFNLGGVQLWNGIRTIDFLCSMPYVDPERIGVTGASGGATQTIFLMTADDRVKVAAPVNIIGAAKHPGCGCENLPGLWLDTSTVEMAAAFAPKPLLLMSATEDPWTNNTPDREYPMIRKYYSLYGAENMLKNVHIKAAHNYNAETRAAVYDWFCKHLKSSEPPIKNPVAVSNELKNLGDLRVFPDKILPESALNGFQIIANWEKASEENLEGYYPQAERDYKDFVTIFRNKLCDILAVGISPAKHEPNDPFSGLKKSEIITRQVGAYTHYSAFFGNYGKGDYFEIESVKPQGPVKEYILLVFPETWGGLFLRDTDNLKPEIINLLEKGYLVARIHGYASGKLAIPQNTLDSYNWSNVYNRNNRLNGIQDIATAVYCISNSPNPESAGKPKLTVIGWGECGIPTAFACAAIGGADRVIVDMNGSDPGYDGELVKLMPYGAIKRIGDFRTATLLLMQNNLILCNAGSTFDKDWYKNRAVKLEFEDNLKFRSDETCDSICKLF
ncbi:MAG: hypothetical protein JXB48_01155 [Candidatus Latescibacteria bacterium]|nr:hypothetical protein [Candidatus Latescibacterota bacterium]